MAEKSRAHRAPNPPTLDKLPLVHASEDAARWLEHYWHKLRLPPAEAYRLAMTEDRHEFHRWTGRRLNPLALGCYCYLPNASGSEAEMTNEAGSANAVSASALLTAPASAPPRMQPTLPGFGESILEPNGAAPLWSPPAQTEPATDYRHLIFVEPDLLPLGIEVTVAHELIHLADRVHGNPRKHRCHGYDSISTDEAAITDRDPELLRRLLREETERREQALRKVRPYRYLYVCPNCTREYPRVKRYPRPVSCGRCDRQYNPAFLLELRGTLDKNGQCQPLQ
jgi:hypothetical protein